MISGDIYLTPILNNIPRLLGLLNRNISSSSYGCFDRDYWHYNTIDFACARKQEAVLTLTLLYLIKHEKNRYYHSSEILNYIRAAMQFWTKIQNENGSFNEWYPNEHSFVVTSFSTYAVSECLLLLKEEIPKNEVTAMLKGLRKSGDWLNRRNETRVMNQQTGAAIALLNIYLLTDNSKYLESSKEKILLLNKRQSVEGWFLEYGGPDIGYLSLAIDYLAKYYNKTKDSEVKEIIDRSLGFMKYFVQPNLVAGGEYTSRNTEYLIPHGFETFAPINEDARFIASVVRKGIFEKGSFPGFFDDRYLSYVGYTWLQAYMDADPGLDETFDTNITNHFGSPFNKYFEESGLLIMNDDTKHQIINLKKGGAFRLFDKRSGATYSDSGIIVRSDSTWYTSGWLAEGSKDMDEDSITISGNMWKVQDKALTPMSNILLRLFQMTFGRSSFISLWVKERLRDMLITKAKPSPMRYNRKMFFDKAPNELLNITDSVSAEGAKISSVSIFTKDTHVYVPSSRYYVDMKASPFIKDYPVPSGSLEIRWKISMDSGVEFDIKD